MSNKDLLDNIKKLRELTGVGFKDCKAALDETKGDLDKSIEFLRKKGIAKASKKMSRTASEGLVLVTRFAPTHFSKTRVSIQSRQTSILGLMTTFAITGYLHLSYACSG